MSFDGLDKNAFWKILPPTLVLRKKKKKKVQSWIHNEHEISNDKKR